MNGGTHFVVVHGGRHLILSLGSPTVSSHLYVVAAAHLLVEVRSSQSLDVRVLGRLKMVPLQEIDLGLLYSRPVGGNCNGLSIVADVHGVICGEGTIRC